MASVYEVVQSSLADFPGGVVERKLYKEYPRFDYDGSDISEKNTRFTRPAR